MRIVPLLLTVFAFTASLASQAQESAANTEFRVDSDASWLRVLAYPHGPLRRFGHHHVISHHGISGTVVVASDPLESSFMLKLTVADLAVDDPALRDLEGEDFDGDLSQKDIDGTRGNMLGEKLLNAEQFPTIQIQSTGIDGSMPDVNIVTTVTVIGMEQTVIFPASIELTDDSFVASGQLEITHGELGLSPFIALGGSLSVRDLLVLKYEIHGTSVTESDNHISVDTDWGRNKITVIVRVPRNENLDLSTTNDGEIIVSNIQGALELENTNGPITATNIAGSVIAETVNATIDVGFSSIDGSSAMSFSSINGDLIIGLPADAGVQLHLDSARGEIFSDFEVDVQPSKPIVERVDGRGRGRVQVRVENAIVANVNGGGSVIKRKTLNGDIQIRKSGN